LFFECQSKKKEEGNQIGEKRNTVQTLIAIKSLEIQSKNGQQPWQFPDNRITFDPDRQRSGSSKHFPQSARGVAFNR